MSDTTAPTKPDETSSTTETCRTCGEEFSAAPNWLVATQTCPECFSFPDCDPDTLARDEFDVYAVVRVGSVAKEGIEESAFRVAARSEWEARWFTAAYCALDYLGSADSNRDRLRSVVADGRDDHVTFHAAGVYPESVPHNGYCVRKLDFRGTGADRIQRDEWGDNTIDQLQQHDTFMDVLIHASDEQIEHKHRETVPDSHECYWTVNGRPRQTRVTNRVFLTDGDRIAAGQIQSVEKGRIWFSPVRDVRADLPTEPPTRGFTYINPADVELHGVLEVADE